MSKAEARRFLKCRKVERFDSEMGLLYEGDSVIRGRVLRALGPDFVNRQVDRV